MAGTTRLELATSAVTEWEHQVLPTTYKAVRDCQVLENTLKPKTFRVGHRAKEGDLKSPLGWPNRVGTCWLVHRAAFVRFAIRKLQGSGLFGLCEALLVRFSLSRHCLTAQEALTQLA